MERYWIGDLRCRTLELAYNNSEPEEYVHHYVYEDFADRSWFATSACKYLEQVSPANSSIIIMLGLVDCIQSCLWSSIKITDIANEYATTINSIATNYSGSKVYICSVNPVNADYTSAYSATGSISATVLNNKIKAFNEALQAACAVTYIDSNEYLTKTDYSTQDGIRYNFDTSIGLQAFILSNLQEDAGVFFVPRFTAPIIEGAQDGDDVETSEDYWINTAHGGENPFMVQGNYGSTLPNCTAYAWGRFYEIIGSKPNLCVSYGGTHNAEFFYQDDADGYVRGDTPALGAIICWEGVGDRAGHVAIVEQINDDGSIITSESGYQSSLFWLKKRKNNASMSVEYKNGKIVETGSWNETGTDTWGAGSGYTFQGFIYCPAAPNTGNIACTVSKSMVTSNNTSLGAHQLKEDLSNISDISDAMRTNALYIWQYLGNKGWSMNAVAGMLGNMMAESTINPGRWQGGKVNVGPAYGLVQWDPFSKYIDWCSANGYDREDIDSALKRIELEVEANEESGWQDLDQWISTDTYDISFKEFTTSTQDAAWLAGAFLLNYERAGDQSVSNQKARGRNANYWYEFLTTNTGYSQKFYVDGFKLDKVLPTSIEASFIVKKGSSYSYTLLENGETVADNGSASDFDDGLILLKLNNNIKPNTNFILKLTVTDNNDKNIEKYLEFKTPQSYPESIKDIKLACKDVIKSVSSKFTLSVKKPSKLGYWTNKKGYEEHLFVNGKLVETKITESITDINIESFTIESRYGYKCKTGDTIQIGFRVWVEDDNAEKLYDSQAAKTSKPICLLNRPVLAYLNID